MNSLQEVADFIARLCEKPSGWSAKQLEKLSSLKPLSRPLDYSPESLETFSNSVKRVCNLDSETGTSFVIVLLEHGLLEVLATMFEDATEKWKDQYATEQVLNIMDILCAMGNATAEAKTLLADAFAGKFLNEILRKNDHRYTMEVVKSINLLFERCSVHCREKLLQDTEIVKTLQTVAAMIYTAGDYEIQVGIIECLFRFTPRRHREKFASKFFTDASLAKQFLDIKDSDFETDCRQFLNRFNSQLTTQSKVFSCPCLSVQLGMQKLKKPSDNNCADFWVDFNPGLARLSLFCEQELSDSQGEETLWETVSIWKKDIRSYHLDVEKNPIVLTLSLKTSLENCVPGICDGQIETYGSLSFVPSLATDLEEALVGCYGKELKWTKSKKSSNVVTPLHLKIQHQKDEVDTGEEQRKNKLAHKGSVPSHPMVTPTRLTVIEIKKSTGNTAPTKPVTLPGESSDHIECTPSKLKPKASPWINNAKRENKRDTKDNTGLSSDEKRTPSKQDLRELKSLRPPYSDAENIVDAKDKAAQISDQRDGDQTPSKLESKARKSPRSPYSDGKNKRDNKIGSSKTKKDTPTPKTPIGKWTRSRGKVKTPLVLQTTETRGNRNKKTSVETSSASEKLYSNKSSHVLSENPDKNLCPDVISIPDSLPIDKYGTAATSIEEQKPPEKDKLRKSMSDSGISVHDLSSQEKDKSRTENLSPQKDASKVVAEMDVGENSGEISVESSAECSATFPRRTAKSMSGAKLPSAITVVQDSQVISPAYPAENINVVSQEKPIGSQQSWQHNAGKGKRKKRKAPCKRKAYSKLKGSTTSTLDENTSGPQTDISDEDNNFGSHLIESQTSVNSLEDFSCMRYPLHKKNDTLSFNSSLNRPISDKQPVYSSSLSQFPSSKTNKDPYEFDVDTESNASSLHKIKEKEKVVSKPNRIFKSKNRCAESEKRSRSVGKIDSFSKKYEDKFKRKPTSKTAKNMTDLETDCFGFDSPMNTTEAKRDQSENLSLTVNKSEEQQTISVNISPGKHSKKHFQFLTLQKIQEKVEQAAVILVKSPSPSTYNCLGTPALENVDTVYGADDHITLNTLGSHSASAKPKSQKNRRNAKDGIYTNSRSDENMDNSDDNIVSGFKSICKDIVSGSVRQKKRRKCKKSITYKDVSNSDIDETDSEDNDTYIPPEMLSGCAGNFDARSEISWLGSQRRKKKPPAKSYTLKSRPGNTGQPNFFDFKTLGLFQDDGIHSTAESPEKDEKTSLALPNIEKASNNRAKSERWNDLRMDHSTKVLTVSITPLKLDDLNKDISDKGIDLNREASSSDEQNFEEIQDSCEDEDDLNGNKNGSDVVTLSPTRNPSHAETEISLATPSVSDVWNNDLIMLTPSVSHEVMALAPVHLDKEIGNSPTCISGPSATFRLTKSTLKRKYEDIPKNDSEDNYSDVSGEFEENSSALIPRKLFKSVIKDNPKERMNEPETEASVRSFSSDESMMQMEIGDMSLQNGVTTFIQTFGIDLQKQMKEKRKRLDQLMRGATKATHNNLNCIWTQRSENRAQLMDNLKKNMLDELIELENDVSRLKTAEEQTTNFFERQLKVLQSCRKSQEQRLKNLKRLHLCYDQNMGKAASAEKQQQLMARDSLKAEMASLHKKLLRDVQQQEMGKFKRNLSNLI